MTYEYHKKGMCDRCGEKPEVWKIPYLYKDMNDKAHPDIGNGYRQYFVCEECKKREERMLAGQHPEWNKLWVKKDE